MVSGTYRFSLEGRPIIPKLTCPICESTDCYICKSISKMPVIKCRNIDCGRMTVCEYDINQGVMGMARINHGLHIKNNILSNVSSNTNDVKDRCKLYNNEIIIDKSKNDLINDDTKFLKMASKIFELTNRIASLENQLSEERLVNALLLEKQG